MFDITFEFENFTSSECEVEIEAYLKQHINQDRTKRYLEARELYSCFSIPDTAFIIFGSQYNKDTFKITHALKTNESIYKFLGLQNYTPDLRTQHICNDLYDIYMAPTIRAITDKCLFYLMLQFDTGFIRWVTTKEEYKFLQKEFKTPYPTFGNTVRLCKLQGFSRGLV